MEFMLIAGTLVVVSLLSLLNGAECVNLTCAGCQSEPGATEYFCRGSDRYLLFHCESKSVQLNWNIDPLFPEPVALGPTSRVDNVIHRDPASIVVDTVNFTDPDNIRIVSNLWLNLGLLTSNVTVFCYNQGETHNKTLNILDDVVKPTSVRAAAYSISQQKVVFYEWAHAEPDTVECYNTMTYIDSMLASNITLPPGSVNGSTIITQTSQGTIWVDIETVDICGDRHTVRVEPLADTTNNTLGCSRQTDGVSETEGNKAGTKHAQLLMILIIVLFTVLF